MPYLAKMFAVSLILTLVIELSVGYFMGIRGKRNYLLMCLVNLLTNPAAVLACFLGAKQLPVEIGVVLVEAAVYLWFSRDDKWEISHPVLLALMANGISWTSGILIQALGG